ncbi:coiled-coil domain-containing protein 74A isoform X1 [Leucoraja erinacea]|uniref:coiled-coil domain-containing protein 74A isoform X1 n=1 Tax=Leucoraja erinaceus TaxID=7782 RepID=UPI0024554DAC|nr:coiled-coil domain-containing protein 74A isoform X1 [Leucoraja erinacea]XP_055511909.1 coiled-coil domain-containing protein 74A isoform X1 [Leucoraja erinacea]
MEALSAGDMSSTSLPPLRNLPQWSRVGNLDRTRYPRSFPQGNVNPIPLTPAVKTKTNKTEAPQQPSHVYEQQEVDPNLRVTTLEKNLKFLQEQHSETLGKLHKEIELLKQANQDLNFKMIMNQRPTHQDPKPGEPVEMEEGALKLQLNKTSGSSSCTGPITSLTDAVPLTVRDHSSGKKHSQRCAQRRAMLPEDGAKEQRAAPKESQKQSCTRRKLFTEAANKRSNGPAVSQQTCAAPPELDKAEMLIISLTPLLIQINPSESPRAPTLQECAIIVRHLHNTSSLQSQELLRLKTSLRDLLYSNKWTPDAYLLAKAYLAELSQEQDVVQLPKVPLTERAKRLRPEATVPTADRVILPALKQTVGNRATERQRRLQAVQKNRYRKVLL